MRNCHTGRGALAAAVFPTAMIVLLALAGSGCESKVKRYIREGDRLRKDEKPSEALALYEKAAEADPMSAKAHEKIASVHKFYARYDKALEHYLKAFEIDPDRVALYEKIVGSYLHLYGMTKQVDDLSKAREFAEKGLNDRLARRDPELTDELKAYLTRVREMMAEAAKQQEPSPTDQPTPKQGEGDTDAAGKGAGSDE